MYCSLINLGILCAASAWDYWTGHPKKEQQKSLAQNLKQTDSNAIHEVVDHLDSYSSVLGTAKKVIKWAKKGLDLVTSALKSESLTENFSLWIRSPQAAELYTMAGGTLVLTYINWKSPKENQSLFKTLEDCAWSLAKQSKKIADSYALIKSVTALVKKPQNHLLPMAFAASMIFAGYLANDKG